MATANLIVQSIRCAQEDEDDEDDEDDDDEPDIDGQKGPILMANRAKMA